MRKRKKTVKRGRRIIIALSILIMAVVVALLYSKNGSTVTGEDDSGVRKEAYDERVSYIGETAYDGSVPIDPEVFYYPFQKTGKYVMNKDYIGSIEGKKAERMKKAVEDYLTMVYGNGFRNIASDEQGFCDGVEGMYAGSYLIEGGKEKPVSQMAEELAEWYIDNHVKSEVTVETADYLIWKDNHPYVRYIMGLRLFSCADTLYLSNALNTQIEEGDTIRVIMDIGLAGTGDGYKVCAVSTVGEIKEETK